MSDFHYICQLIHYYAGIVVWSPILSNGWTMQGRFTLGASSIGCIIHIRTSKKFWSGIHDLLFGACIRLRYTRLSWIFTHLFILSIHTSKKINAFLIFSDVRNSFIYGYYNICNLFLWTSSFDLVIFVLQRQTCVRGWSRHPGELRRWSKLSVSIC